MKHISGYARRGRILVKLCTFLAIGIVGLNGMPVSASSASIKDGDVVRVTADQAMTYSVKTKNNVPNTAYYPLPQGTVDTVTGKRISYKTNGTTHYFYKLSSGLRVSADDIKKISESAPENNRIRGLTLTSDKHYTYIKLKTDEKVPYKVTYKSDGISFNFKYTSETPKSEPFDTNPLFDSAKWKNSTLTLSFKEEGAYMGYRAYYDKNDNLVLRFTNIPSSISATHIVIDAGHGGKDFGALGEEGYHEKDINRAIAELLVAELDSRGAEVTLLEPNGHDAKVRRKMAEDLNADFFISIHCNSAANTKATGTEVYYFRNANSQFAKIMSKNVSGGLETDNRGAKKGIFHVTLSSQMPSLLVETGFMSNSGEYKKLKKESYQQEIATGIANSIEELIDQMS